MHHFRKDTAPGAPALAWLLFFAALLSAPPIPAEVYDPPPGQPVRRPNFGTPFTPKAPVLLEAARMEYDQEKDVVTAIGDVVVTQGETVVMAERLSYDQKQNQVRASGNVSMLAPSGDVYFADSLVLQDDLKAGVIHQFKARLVDDSLFVAARAERFDENVTVLDKAAYTPCKCEADGAPKKPTWRIRADRATIDQQEQEVRYKNATFDAFGVPILYTPYFSHPTPDADNKSGLLMPVFIHSGELGAVYRQPVYYSIAADRDMTFTPMLTGHAGPVLGMEYRQLFDAGSLGLNGSGTMAPDRDGLGNRVPGREFRGHVDARGAFTIDEHYDWGFDVRRSTDETYLRLYDFSNETLLTSKVYAQGFNFIEGYDRTYGSVNALSFQGLTDQDDEEIIPVVAPLVDLTWQSNPGWHNSRLRLDANAMSLFRQTGSESRRLSTIARWKLPYITPDGQVIELNAQLRNDIYDVSNQELSDGSRFDGVTGRSVPEVSMLWRYPFITRIDPGTSVMFEPIVEFAASPGGGNPEKIPNEDSLVPEFTDTNLFAHDRYAGLDRIENGPRTSYGLRGQVQMDYAKYLDWLFGQHYRFNNEADFPFANDLHSHFSDYVGKVGLSYDPFMIAYRFRLNRDTLAANRSEVDTSFNFYPVSLLASYLSLKNDPVLATKEVITGSGSLHLTRQWSWMLSGSHDLERKQTDAIYTGLTFKNECVNVITMVGRDYTNLLDVEPSTTVWFRVSLRNLD